MNNDSRIAAALGSDKTSVSTAPACGASQGNARQYYAHVTGSTATLPAQLAIAANAIQQKFGAPVILFIQNGDYGLGEISNEVWLQFVAQRDELPKESPVILLNSPGGYADAAYRLAQLFQIHCGGYRVLVPAMAKSAATLFSLGANPIIVGRHAEFGPLDAQLEDFEREQRLSALEVTQSLERLNSEALQAVDAAMVWWARRSGKKIDTLLPIAANFVATMMHPLFDKIDTVHYTKMARVLKVAFDYATRLLMRAYDQDSAELIAGSLTEIYSEHGFVIDAAEMRRIGLKICETDEETEKIIAPLVAPFAAAQHDNYLGLLREDKSHEQKDSQSAKPAEGAPNTKPRGRRRKRDQSDQAVSQRELGPTGKSDS